MIDTNDLFGLPVYDFDEPVENTPEPQQQEAAASAEDELLMRVGFSINPAHLHHALSALYRGIKMFDNTLLVGVVDDPENFPDLVSGTISGPQLVMAVQGFEEQQQRIELPLDKDQIVEPGVFLTNLGQELLQWTQVLSSDKPATIQFALYRNAATAYVYAQHGEDTQVLPNHIPFFSPEDLDILFPCWQSNFQGIDADASEISPVIADLLKRASRFKPNSNRAGDLVFVKSDFLQEQEESYQTSYVQFVTNLSETAGAVSAVFHEEVEVPLTMEWQIPTADLPRIRQLLSSEGVRMRIFQTNEHHPAIQFILREPFSKRSTEGFVVLRQFPISSDDMRRKTWIDADYTAPDHHLFSRVKRIATVSTASLQEKLQKGWALLPSQPFRVSIEDNTMKLSQGGTMGMNEFSIPIQEGDSSIKTFDIFPFVLPLINMIQEPLLQVLSFPNPDGSESTYAVIFAPVREGQDPRSIDLQPSMYFILRK
ncbi:MAG: hypothetical protein D6698_01605 [Gammaproteobacteria bacterium]|nr:MAG: hypothetical protein D6698_01605 [Gammaproteobacteria bacterium]